MSADQRLAEAKAATAELKLRSLQRAEANILAACDAHRVYHWYGPVGLDSVADAIETTERWSRRDPGEPIQFIFNSPGGDVSNGFALFDHIQLLRRRGHHITTRAAGMAASMGAVLLQAGDIRIIDPRCVLLIHELSGMTAGRTTELEIEMQYFKKLQSLAVDALAERAKVTRATIIKNWKKGDWWLNAEEVLKYGFADEIS